MTASAAADLCQLMGPRTQAAFLVAQAFNHLLPTLCDRESPHDWDVKPLRRADGNPVLDEVGNPKLVKVFPEAFMRRLVGAHAAGAFERLSPEAIAQRILTTDEPEHAACES